MYSAAARSQVYIQITDPHLFADKAGRFNGAETLAGLRAVIAHVRDHLPEPDGFLLTGDLVHDESALGYQHLVEAFSGRQVLPDVWERPQ